MSKKYYTGVGSRNSPRDICALMTKLSKWLMDQGWTLRSGGAKGADQAFATGIYRQKEIYTAKDATQQAMSMAAKYHAAWECVSSYARQLHGRNAFQVLGRDLETPSTFLVCWTPDGCISHETRGVRTGGTGTAISIASVNNIPVFNLQRDDHRKRIEDKVGVVGTKDLIKEYKGL